MNQIGSVLLNSCFVMERKTGDVRLAVFSHKSQYISKLCDILLNYYCETSQIDRYVITAHRGLWKFGTNGILYSESRNYVIDFDTLISSIKQFDDVMKKYDLAKITRQCVIDSVGEDAKYPTTFWKRVFYKERHKLGNPDKCCVPIYAGIYLQTEFVFHEPKACFSFS